jgi:hypothetical protein
VTATPAQLIRSHTHIALGEIRSALNDIDNHMEAQRRDTREPKGEIPTFILARAISDLGSALENTLIALQEVYGVAEEGAA